MTGERLDLSILIVNWNVRDILRDCLISLQRQMRLAPDRYEIIIVDNASVDGSVEMLRADFPDVRLVVSDTNLGFTQGCQVAYEVSSGDIVLLLNPDTVILDGAVDTMLADLCRHPDAGILGSRLLNGDGSFQRASGGAFPSLANMACNYLFLNRILPRGLAPDPVFLEEDRTGIFEIDWISGAALMFRREVVGERIFDPAYFMFGEDMDLCDRVHRRGWKVLYSANQSIIHHHGQSFRIQSSVDVLSTIYKGPRTFFRKGHGPVSVFIYDVVLLVGFLIRWVVYEILAPLKPGRGYRDLARFSRQYVGIMLRSLWVSS